MTDVWGRYTRPADPDNPFSEFETRTMTTDPPIPLTATKSIPKFPVHVLPSVVRSMVEAIAEQTQTDPAMAGTSALSALAACTGGHAQLEIRRGWREPLCIYTVTVAKPAERKSAVQNEMLRPLLAVEEELAAAGASARVEAETQKSISLAEADKLRRAAANADDKTARAEATSTAISASGQAEAITVPPIPRLVADDITPEAAASLLAEQGGRLAIISAEGGIFDIIAGRYSKSIPNLDLWLKGHSGDSMKVDRRGRDEYVKSPALTLGLMIQPDVLTRLAKQESFAGRGFLARILFSMPTSMVGERRSRPEPAPQDVIDRYSEVIGGLARGLAEWAGDPAIVRLTPEADDAVERLQNHIEPMLGDDGALAQLSNWGGKYVGAVCRIAGLLHFAEKGPEAYRAPVSAETIDAATALGEWFMACAVNAFSEMGQDEATRDAIYLSDRIASTGQDEISERDMKQAAKKFKTKGDMAPALEKLIDHGYLIPGPAPEPTGGRPRSRSYTVVRPVDRADF